MAKKVVATLKQTTGQELTKVIKMARSAKTGAYTFKEAMVFTTEVQAFLEKK